MVVELGKCIKFEDLYKTPYFGKHISNLYLSYISIFKKRN